MFKGKSLVIIPSYNESENIIDIINDTIKLKESFHLLIVDDNSPDKTFKLVEEEMIKNPKRIFLIRRKKKLGLGTAYIEGFKWAIDKGYDRICLLYTSPSPRDRTRSRMPSSA